MPRLFAILLLASVALAQETPQQLTIQEIFAEGGLTGRMPESIQWSPDGTKLSYVLRNDTGEHGQLWYVDAASGKPAVLVSEAKLQTLSAPTSKLKSEREKERRERYHVAAYHWAPDSKHLLFDSNGQLWLYSLETQTAIPFTGTPEPTGDPKFSSDGKHVSYLKDHNIFVRTIDGKREAQLTRSPDANTLNGEVDWVYAEELDVRSNYFWSPDNSHIVFMQMNEKGVPAYPIEDFLPTHPTVDEQKYPQAGDENPSVRLGVISSSGGSAHWLRLPEQKVDEDTAPASPIGSPSDIYVPRFGWVNDHVLYAEVLNRAQNELKLYFIDAGSGRSKLMLDEKDDTWLDVNDDFRLILGTVTEAGQPSSISSSFSPSQFIWGSWRDGFTHLYLYSFDGKDPLAHPAKLERQLTHGNFEVLSAEAGTTGLDAVIGQTVYFTSNESNDLERQLYAVDLNGGEPRQLSRGRGNHDAVFPDDAPAGASGVFYADTFSNITTPPTLSFCKVGGDCQPIWESRSVAAYNLPQPQFVDFKADDGTVLHGTIILPASSSGAASVPLLNTPYGGPHAQSVRDYWGPNAAAGSHLIFSEVLAQQGIATLTVDNRGMGGRGKKFTGTLRRNFGEMELRDQLAAIDQALKRFPQLDANRMGWYGWSYGGYMTLYALTHSTRFRAGVAGAPVTDWRDYDSIYTERYMGLPQENAAAYKKSSPVSTAADLHGDLLIVHGTGDDNVHFSNTIQMVQALLNAGKQFDLMLLPGKTHASLGGVTNTDLYTRIHDHFMRALMNAK